MELSRRKNAPGITTPLIDQLITAARRAGSTGAKACGAGGGGCVVFLVEPGAKEKVARVIEAAARLVLAARVAPRGVVGALDGKAAIRSVLFSGRHGVRLRLLGPAELLIAPSRSYWAVRWWRRRCLR